MSGSSLETPALGIGRLLKESGSYLVPHHQRDYSWTEDEIEQLFEDICEAKKGGQVDYFIGLMVFMSQNAREYTILDGQQRIATTVIILSAIRSWLRARPYERDANQIQTEYIEARELGKDEGIPRLVLNENNRRYFQKFVVLESPLASIENELTTLKRYDPNRLLLQAIILCRKKIEELAGNYSDENDAAENLFDFVRYLRDNVKIVRFTVSNEADAYTIFETLNDRGLDLSVLDLVKNYLFGKAIDDTYLRDIQKQWAQMMGTITNVAADDFLKAWWTSRYGRVQKPQLYSKFKNEINNWSKIYKTSADMLKASEYYTALEIADDPIWAELTSISRDRIRSLKLLGSKQVHPVLLSARAKFNSRELERLLRFLEVLIVRYQLIGGGRTGRLEISCASLAHQIWEGKVNTASQAFVVMKDIYPSDDDFRSSFMFKQERNNQKARWILSKLEDQARQERLTDSPPHELEPSGSLTLEHILPKEPGENWNEVLKSDFSLVEDMLFRLGNMCLLSQINRKIGNKSFIDKKKVYSKSDLFLTQEVASYASWDRQAMDDRQKKLSKHAVALWRFQ